MQGSTSDFCSMTVLEFRQSVLLIMNLLIDFFFPGCVFPAIALSFPDSIIRFAVIRWNRPALL